MLPFRSVESVPEVLPSLWAGAEVACGESCSVPAVTAVPLSSFFFVPLPTTPSADRPLARWNALTASVVSAPKRPSMRPL